MNYHLAQLNIAKFRVHQDDPVNKGFIDNIDRLNAIAEKQDGFVWRFQGDGNSAIDVQAFDDPDMVVNMSVWADIHSLVGYVYREKAHKEIMSQRKQWFDKIDFHMVLWWIEEGQEPTLEDAKIRLDLLRLNGPTYSAFTFKKPFAAPSGEIIKPFENPNA